jgi:ketosteroid isomerase-like protein
MSKSDAQHVEDTARAYFEAWFDADEARMDRVLHPDLVKRRAGAELGVTTKERMLELTRNGEGREDGADRTLHITVDTVGAEIASATVRSVVYHEVLQLVRTPGGWQIANALWEPA